MTRQHALAGPALPEGSRHLRRGRRIGKYRIVEALGAGGYAHVYRALDEVEAREVALKIPHERGGGSALNEILREVRITVQLDHEHILPIRNATLVEGDLVIAYPLGKRSLARRLRHRIASHVALDIFQQVLEAVSYAHERRVIHCDINPDNIILFDDNVAKLSDFGIARFSLRTRVVGSGSGTVGYMAPEQAMGRPSFRSDVFSMGLLLYRMLTGELPKWPYRWPPPQIAKLRRKASPELIAFLRKSIDVNDRKRYRDGRNMLNAYARLRRKLRG